MRISVLARLHLYTLPLALAALVVAAAPGQAAKAAVVATDQPASQATRIAVLPFNQLHTRPEDEFLKAGFAETLTTSLARVRSLQVVERGQIMRVFDELKLQHGGMVDDSKAAQIGKLVGAGQVVLGSFMRAGTTIRVDCRFVDSETGTVDPGHTASARKKLTSEDDLLDILDDLAAEVVKGFGVETTAHEQQQIQQVTHATSKVGAFQYYTQAREKFLLYTPEGYREASPLFRKAIEVDEGYALAWAGLAETLGFWGFQKQLNGEDASEDYRLSLEAAKKAVEIAPNLGEAYRALSEAYSHVGEGGDSSSERGARREKAARKAIELNDRDAEAYFMLWSATGKSLEGDGFGYVQKALEINPRLQAAHVDLGVEYKEAGRIEDAIRHYKIALEINARDANAWNNIANAYLDQDKVDDAIAAYQKALEIQDNDAIVLNNYGNALKRKDRFDDAIAAYQKSLKINPKYANAHYNLGVIYRRQDKLDDAEACYLRAIEINPKDPDFFTALGAVYRLRKTYAKAIETYQKALDLKEEDSVTWYFIGECHKAMAMAADGDAAMFRKAVAAYEKCAEYDPKDPDPWFALGVVYDKLKRLDDSIAAYRKAIELKPSNADANYNLAWQLKGKGDKAAAAAAMRRFLELARGDESQAEWIPKGEKFLKDLGNVSGGGGGTITEGGSSEDAEVTKARKAVNENPRSANAHYNLALLLLRRGKLEQAEPLFLKAIALNDEDPDFFRQLGNVYRQRKEWEKAIRTYGKALNLREEDSVTYYYLGDCYRGLADAAEGAAKTKLLDEAIDAYDTCAKYNPKDPDPYYSKAFVLREKGDRKGALESMKRFLEMARGIESQKDWISKGEKFIRDLEAL